MATSKAVLEIQVEIGRASGEIDRLKQKVAELSRAGGGAGGALGGLNNSVKTGQERIEKLATAVTGASSVLGGLGSQAGATFGAVSNLAAAFLTGGPLLAGMALATTGAAVLFGKLSEGPEDSQAAADGMKVFTESLNDARKAADDARDAVFNFGKSSAEVAEAKAQDALAESQEKLALAEKDVADGIHEVNELRRQAAVFITNLNKARTGEVQLTQEAKEEAGRLAAQYVRLANERHEEIKQAPPKLAALKEEVRLRTLTAERTEEHRQKIEAKERADKRAKNAAGAAAVEEITWADQKAANVAFLEKVEKEARAEGRRRSDEERREREANIAHRTQWEAEDEKRAERRHRESLRKRKKAEREALAERKEQIAEQRAAEQKATRERIADVQKWLGVIESASNMATSIALDSLEDLVAGEEVAWQQIAFGMLKSIGTQIIGIGIRDVAEGTSLVTFSGGADPRGASLIGQGIAKIGIGGAMGGTGAIGGGLARRAEAGGVPGLGGAGGSISGGRVRAPSRTGGESRTGGGQQTTTFVFNAPTFGNVDSAARQVSQLQNRSREFLEA